jgi:plasmid stability protein
VANLTITIHDDLLHQARLRALDQGTSVNALLRQYLEAFAGSSASVRAGQAILTLARDSRAGSGPTGRTWTRDELHER